MKAARIPLPRHPQPRTDAGTASAGASSPAGGDRDGQVPPGSRTSVRPGCVGPRTARVDPELLRRMLTGLRNLP
jgi:hypothetical protein